MRRKLIAFTLFAIFCASCGGGSTGVNLDKRDTVYTTVDVVGDVNINDYPRVTAMKVIFHEKRTVVEVDSSRNGSEAKIIRKTKTKIVKDSTYLIWYPVIQKDSAGKVLRNRANTSDSFAFKFNPIERNRVLLDWNKNWPLKQ
jgi:hypothetical protein